MSNTGPEAVRARICATAADFWINREVDDVPPGWIDHMIRRLFDEWNRQMIRFEGTGKTDKDEAAEVNRKDAVPDSPDKREQDVRTLAKLQRSLAELIKLETARAKLRTNKKIKSDENTRPAFERRLAKLAAGAGAPDISGEIDE